MRKIVTTICIVAAALVALAADDEPSNQGQVNGPSGIRGYCHLKPISADRKGKGPIQGGYPYTRKGEDGMQKFIKILFGTKLARWLPSFSSSLPMMACLILG